MVDGIVQFWSRSDRFSGVFFCLFVCAFELAHHSIDLMTSFMSAFDVFICYFNSTHITNCLSFPDCIDVDQFQIGVKRREIFGLFFVCCSEI